MRVSPLVLFSNYFYRLLGFLIISAISSIALATDGIDIEWEVYTPLRLIVSHDAYEKFSIKNKETVFYFITKQLGEKNLDGLPPLNDTVWKKNSSDYIRIERNHFFPNKETVKVNLSKKYSGLCTWNYKEQHGRFDCNNHFLFEAIVNADNAPTLTITLPTGKMITENVVVHDRLILGLGDSYASGEGNPDKPSTADLGKLEQRRLLSKKKNNSETGRWLDNTDTWLDKPAEWLDPQCHRSMLSQHILASMRLAEKNPHESITILPLACSGAEIMDGVLTPQVNPPGDAGKPPYKRTRMGKITKRKKINYTVKESQLNSAIRHLCSTNEFVEKDVLLHKRDPKNSIGVETITKMLRCKGELRKPDAIFLSIGGNDAGFSSAIAWAALPSSGRHLLGGVAVKLTHLAAKPICPKSNDYYKGFDCQKFRTAKERVREWLPDYYESLADELIESGLVSNPEKIFLTAYPNPLYIEDGKTFCGKNRSEDALEQFRSQIPKISNTQIWNIWMTKAEMKDLNEGLFIPLTEMMRSSAKKHSWTYVDKHVSKIQKHGICAGFERQGKYNAYPHPNRGVWHPKDPSSEWAYDSSRVRWIRNTNDTLLFQSDGTPGKLNGAFHPDARAHAVIADELFEVVVSKWNENDEKLKGEVKKSKDTILKPTSLVIK